MDQDQNNMIKLCVRGQDGVTVFFRSPRTRSMLSLFQTYCQKRNLEYRGMRFFYNGNRIRSTQTPDGVGLNDDDEIDAMMDQSGGGTVAPEGA